MFSKVYGVVVGAAVAGASGRALATALRSRRGTVRVSGTVVSLDGAAGTAGPVLPSGSGGMSASGPNYRPVIQFQTADGRSVEFKSRLQLNGGAMALIGRRYRPGNQIPVRYQPGNPRRAVVDTALATWVISSFVLAAGLAAMAVSVLTG